MSCYKGKIHVAHVIGSTGLYGAERWILALMRAVDSDRIQSTLINLVDTEGETSEVVEAARERGLYALDFYTGGRLNPFSVFRLARWAKEQSVDIIHGHGFKSDTVGLMAARLAGCKVMTTPHGWSLEADRKLRIYERLDRTLFRFMDMVCPLSADLAKGIKRCAGPASLRLIYNGVDIDEVQSVLPAGRPDPDTYVIGYIGQLIERKDLHTLLVAIKHLCDRKAKVRLMLFGDGPNKAALREETARLGITRLVEFFGYRPDAVSYLKTFNLFVLPSLMEGIPRCIMEAMAAGIPVVVSDITGNRSLVVEGVTGALFTPGDSLGLAEKIVYLMMHPEEAGAMAICAKEKVEEEFSNRRMARDYMALYYELLGRQIT